MQTNANKVLPAVINFDPALIKWYHMHQNRYKYFRWTPRTAKITFAYVVVVPSILLWVAYGTEGKYNMRVKRRGDTILEY
ncbi:NADH:ubiquinone oxidoreductase 6.6kD subunit [Kalaharituber pfeilii]|nr:NADH:ubiquinone oxidoreductase 6.6kD subunit [Kalaharituber pfeilii]